MKLSIFTSVTNPKNRGDNAVDAFKCYEELADEVIILDGGSKYPDGANMITGDIDCEIIEKYYKWPQEFNWPFIGQQFQRGYEACSGDWVIHADIDFIFHERDFGTLRKALELNNDAPALSLWKYQFILPDRYNLKSRLVIAVNKGKYGDRIRFDSGGDLCQPSLDGKELKPDNVPEARVPFYNYEKLLKTEEQITDDVGRMARAWHRHFGDHLLGYDDDTAYYEWLHMAVGRFGKPQQAIELSEHPKFVQETIKNLKPEQWGYSGFDNLERNNYVKSP